MNQQYKNIIKAVEESGEIIAGYFGKSFKTVQKTIFLDFCTEADLKSEANILKAIEKNFPDYNIQSEEKGLVDKKSDFTFVIDPLDGTINLCQGIPYFSVTLALLKNDEAIFAVTHNPISKQTFYAQKGLGAFLNDQKISVSNISEIKKTTVAYGRGWDADEASFSNTSCMTQLYNSGVQRVLNTWSPALDLCLVASGKIEAMVNDHNALYDNLAGKLIVREAGGKITDFDGQPLKNDRVNFFLASNGTEVHSKVLEILNN